MIKKRRQKRVITAVVFSREKKGTLILFVMKIPERAIIIIIYTYRIMFTLPVRIKIIIMYIIGVDVAAMIITRSTRRTLIASNFFLSFSHSL